MVKGKAKRIVWCSDGKRLRGKTFYEALDGPDRAKVKALFLRMANNGEISNTEHFKSEGEGIFCFKRYQIRFPCFFDGPDVVITQGFTKKSQKIPPDELVRAKRIRKQYLATKGTGGK